MVRTEDLLSEFLLPLVDISIQLIPIVSDGKLLIVINWNIDLLLTDRFIIWVVELSHIRMLQGLFS